MIMMKNYHNMEDKDTKAQIIICRCGSTIAACVEPYCYTDARWHKDVKDYTKKGYKIDTVECVDLKMAQCICKDPSENQLKLF